MKEQDAVQTIVSRFLDRMDEVVDLCTDEIWEVVPSYGRSENPTKEDVGDAVRGNVSTLARVLVEQRDIKRGEIEAIEKVGARRAEAAIPLDDVLHAYRTVSRVCWEELAQECRSFEGEALEATIALAEAVIRYTDSISSTVAEAYSRAQRAIVREQEGARREFLADLLYGSDTSPADMLARAHSFGYDLSLSYVALVGIGPGNEARKEASVSTAAANLAGDGGADPIVLQKNELSIALLPADVTGDATLVAEKVVADLGAGWTFGLGGPELGLEGIRRAYIEAREALEIGQALGLDGSLHRFDDLLPYHFLRGDPALVDRFIDQMLGPLIEYDARKRGELMKTLEAFFQADGSVKVAGERLFAHPHTVSYRLKQVDKLTGWSLRDPEDKLRMQLALRAYRLARGRTQDLP